MLTDKFVSQIFALSLQFEDPKLGAENQNQQSYFGFMLISVQWDCNLFWEISCNISHHFPCPQVNYVSQSTFLFNLFGHPPTSVHTKLFLFCMLSNCIAISSNQVVCREFDRVCSGAESAKKLLKRFSGKEVLVAVAFRMLFWTDICAMMYRWDMCGMKAYLVTRSRIQMGDGSKFVSFIKKQTRPVW